MKNIVLIALLSAAIISCKKVPHPVNDLHDSGKEKANVEDSLKTAYKTKFSNVLAKALAADQDLRAFIKTEALKEFDKDHDVLFLTTANKLIGGESFKVKLLKYGLSTAELEQILNNLPTMTILVPTVPNFSPENWNTRSEVPKVAISPNGKEFESISVVDAEGKVNQIKKGLIPGYPIVIVKENERIAVSRGASVQAAAGSYITTTSGGITLKFVDKAYDGRSTDNRKDGGFQIAREVDTLYDTNPIDPRVITAFKKGVEWHSDYIYYGIDPANGVTRGPINSKYREYIRSFRMSNTEWSDIADQDDPRYNGNTPSGRPPFPQQPYYWTDGAYDFRIDVMINAKNGAGQVLRKAFSARGHELYNINFVADGTSGNYRISSVDTKEFFVNEAIDAWDLDAYGSTWKFTVYEFDPAEEVEYTITNTTKFGSNFEINATGEKVKVGAKFGGSFEETKTTSTTVKRTLDSDYLGEGILNFHDPIIVRYRYIDKVGGRPYRRHLWDTWEVNAGLVRISVEPRDITNL
ncbi:hypothetical protein [Pedobacter sp. SYP-B3415]|uniref:hypothetical protein n=1 Tax=Pedobacter sp. SYP-B3415 TaxID=2496641 RepID=UPI00101B9F17|nr:hypothetical protein [Pedobacter sp. SYP-B3415]